MRRIERKGLRAPARVLDIELAAVRPSDEDTVALDRYNTVWCLSRIDGVPYEVSFWDVTEDSEITNDELRVQLGARATRNRPNLEFLRSERADADLTVVICTRDRPAGLRAALRSLQHQTDPDFAVLVVDNGQHSPVATVVDEVGLPTCEYILEPRPGLARARNRALERGPDRTGCLDG